MTNLVKCECRTCKRIFEKTRSEFNRTNRRKAHHFCSLSCTAQYRNNYCTNIGNPNSLIANNKADELSPFRWFVARAKNREAKKGKTDLTPDFLKLLWEQQKGKCPFTNWQLELPISTRGWKSSKSIKRASIDRIDCNKGYTRDNVRFVSWMANIARSNFKDVELVEFCKSVTNNQ